MMIPQEVANCTFAKSMMGGYNMASVDFAKVQFATSCGVIIVGLPPFSRYVQRPPSQLKL